MEDTLRVLYAEDNAFDAQQMLAYVEEHAPDIKLDLVRTGEECLRRLAIGAYDALLLDNHLPDVDGLDILKELGERDLSLPIVVVTGVGDEQLAVKVLGLGAIDYVPKQDQYVERVPAVVRQAVAEHRLLPERHAIGRPRSRRILYVERHPYDIDLTLEHFSRVAPHLTLEVVRSSVEGLARLNEGTFDLVLTDLRMPDLSALDLLKATRQREPPVPCIIVTGQGDELAAVAALKLGASDYIVKRDNYLIQLPYAIDHAITRFELAESNRRLEAELGERRKAEAHLLEHAAALADAARQKEEFLAMLGHELRNPLAPLRTALELLRRFSSDEPVAVNAQEVMERQIEHMVRLLDDVLDVSRITSGRIRLDAHPLDLRKAVAEAVDSARPQIDARHHRLRTFVPDAPLMVYGDVHRLVQVLVNLLDNAAKYTDEGGAIEVSARRQNSHAVLSVSDTGVGVPPRLLPKMFDLFTQDDRTLDRAQGGLGLGLTLVRRITELHGGSVEAHSEGRGHGSTFTIKLPTLGPQAVEDFEADSPSEAAAPPPLRCLVVEDNVDAAKMLQLALEFEGHTVRSAFDGQGAIDLAREFCPDVIVLDIGLPRMNGYEVARSIREIPGLADVLIIAATGYGQETDREKSRAAGIDHHLVKPVELDAVLKAMAAGRTRGSEH
jgi:signal transduction histidine kinase